MSSQRRCQQGKVKSIRSIEGTPASMNGMWSSSTLPLARSGNTGPAPTRRAAPRSFRHRPRSEFPSRGIERFLSPTKSSRTITRIRERPRGDLAAAEAVLLEVAASAWALLAVEEDELHGVARPPDGAGELRRDRGT